MNGDLPDGNAALEYARHLHQELVATNKDLYSRAQTALTLDGLVITIFGAVISASPEDVAKTADQVGPLAAAFGLAAVIALCASVVCAFLALYVRHLSGQASPAGRSVGPSHMWFYARIAEVGPDDFVDAAVAMTAESEARIRLRQVAVMAPIMRRRANWVNGAYAGAALGFLSFVFAASVYVSQLPA